MRLQYSFPKSSVKTFILYFIQDKMVHNEKPSFYTHFGSYEAEILHAYFVVNNPEVGPFNKNATNLQDCDFPNILFPR